MNATQDTGKSRRSRHLQRQPEASHQPAQGRGPAAERSLQPKLTVGQPGDKFEREADAVADRIVKGASPAAAAPTPPPSTSVQRSELPEVQADFESNEEPAVQTKSYGGTPPPGIQREADGTLTAPDSVSRQLGSGGGAPLPESSRAQMEPHLGDLSGVRVHTDSPAVQMSQDLGAKAFTHGNDIYFNQGQYNPGTQDGQRLLAHEATHTAQQNGGIQAQLQRAPQGGGEPTKAADPAMPREEINLQAPSFTPSTPVQEYLEAKGKQGGELKARFGNLARGTIVVVKKGDRYATKGNGLYGLGLSIPALAPLNGEGMRPVLGVRIKEGQISGLATLEMGGKVLSGDNRILKWMADNPAAMGWVGLDKIQLPNLTNTIDGGTLRLQADGIKVRVGGFLDGTMSFGLVNSTATFGGEATVSIPKLDSATFSFSKDEEGNLKGNGSVAVAIANFNGALDIAFLNGIVDIKGTVGYSTERMSGQVTLLVTDADQARNVALSQLNPEQINEGAKTKSGVKEPKTGPQPGPRALAGWGELDFAFTEWMTGKAKVIIDNQGHITIQGQIAPPAEVELFPQKDWVQPLFKLEARAMYGVPLVGNVFAFANIGLDALAKLGPAKLYNIVAQGTYSTDPAVFNDFSLQASFNVSAMAGIRLRAEGGVGVTLIGHDVKLGVGVFALGGVRGYVDATPTIGYREKADPQAGKKGEFFFAGHMEIAAQPFLALGGDLFVELDSPWWSPAPDDRWTWPLGQLEYPLPGQFGIGADIDYVIGSGQVPEVKFGEVDFNKDKFFTDLLDDKVPKKKGDQGEKSGTFEEKPPGSGQGGQDPKLKDSQGKPGDQPATGGPKKKPSQPPTKETMARWQKGMTGLKKLAELSQSNPLNKAGAETAMAKAKRAYGFTALTATRKGTDWEVKASMPNINNHSSPLTFKGWLDPKEQEEENKDKVEGEEGEKKAGADPKKSDQENHRDILLEVRKELQKPLSNPQDSLFSRFEQKRAVAKQVQQKYQKQLKKPLKLTIQEPSVEQIHQAKGFPFKTKIAPNDSTDDFTVREGPARKTQIKTYSPQTFRFNPSINYPNATINEVRQGQVGRKVEATLYVDDVNENIKGEATGSNVYPQLQEALNDAFPNEKWVMGHLLNHDLGGRAGNSNLFPITTGANGEHLQEVEKHVKHWLFKRSGGNYVSREVVYNITAVKDPSDDGKASGYFDCYATVTEGSDVHKINKRIWSKPEGTGSYTRVYGDKANQTITNSTKETEYRSDNTVDRDDHSGSPTIPNAWKH